MVGSGIYKSRMMGKSVWNEDVLLIGRRDILIKMFTILRRVSVLQSMNSWIH